MSETHEEIGEEEVFAVASNLKGDYVTAICDRFRHAPKTWQEMSEDDQKSFIADLSDHADNLITSAIRAIARQGRTVIEAKLDQVTIKDGIKGVVTMSQYAQDRHALYDAQGLPVLIVVAGSRDDYSDGVSEGLGDEQPDFPEENEAA